MQINRLLDQLFINAIIYKTL